jgi:hypothetical protein
MDVQETVPPIVVWSDLRGQIRGVDESEQACCVGFGLSAVEAFELETGIAAGLRTVSVTYYPTDFEASHYRHTYRRVFALNLGGCYIPIPKGPVVSGSAVLTLNGTAIDPSLYTIGKTGHNYYLHLRNVAMATGPYVLTYQAGFATVPQLIKQGVLIHAETLYRLRGATSAQQQYDLAYGLERIYSNYRTFTALAG